MTNIIDACRAERSAEQNRKTAEVAWRRAWWVTTLALAEPTSEADVSRTLDTAEAELGQSRDYLHQRRRTGRAVDHVGLETDVIHTVPPRLAVAWVRGGHALDPDGVRRVVDAEREGIGLREFAAEHTRSGVPQDRLTPERVATAPGASEAVAEAIRQSPALADAAAAALVETGHAPSPAAISKALEDPDTARSVVRRDPHGPAVRNMEREVAATVGVDTGRSAADEKVETSGGWYVASLALDRIRNARMDLRRAWPDMTESQRTRVRSDLADVLAGITGEFLASPVPDDLSSLDR